MQYSLDVEAAVRDGSLDIGMFGPTALVSIEDAELAMARLKELLETFTG